MLKRYMLKKTVKKKEFIGDRDLLNITIKDFLIKSFEYIMNNNKKKMLIEGFKTTFSNDMQYLLGSCKMVDSSISQQCFKVEIIPYVTCRLTVRIVSYIRKLAAEFLFELFLT